MVHRCCISSCKMNVRVAEAKGLSYHCFPLKDPHREKWIQAILPHVDKPESFKIVQGYTRVCSRHFRIKEYSLDSKKRARLNSNAVPSVFPRKNSPVFPQAPSEGAKNQVAIIQHAAKAVNNSNTTTTPTTTLISPKEENPEPEGRAPQEESSLSPSLSGTLSFSDQSILNLLNSVSVDNSDGTPSSSLADDANSDVSNEDKQDQTKRKRRKWNRTAFGRTSKTKQKKPSDSLTCVSTENTFDDDTLEDFKFCTVLGLTRNSSLDLETDLDIHNRVACLGLDTPENGVGQQQRASSSPNLSTNDPLCIEDLNLLSLEEQELLQSIQAVTLDCSEADMNLNLKNIHIGPSSLISEEPVTTHDLLSGSNHKSIMDDPILLEDALISSASEMSLQSSKKKSGDKSVENNKVISTPSASEIDKLACDFRSSLFTSVNLPPGSIDLALEDELRLSVPEFSGQNSLHLDLADNLVSNCDLLEKELSGCASESQKPDQGSNWKQSNKSMNKKGAVPRKKLVGITKKPKNSDKYFGKFSVERFSDSDKDIEYYTSFPTYSHFEAFFNSLESHVEKLKVTDIMHGVADLIRSQKLESQASNGSAVVKEEATPRDEDQKRRPIVGRSMSRMDELFMTLIRLKRRLPEKVLGHMFYVSQPTVSRTVRAWTMLLSKLLEPIPSSSSSSEAASSSETLKPTATTTTTRQPSSKASGESNYFTNKGIYIPDSFRQLFLSDEATSIINSAHNPRVSSVSNNSTSASINSRSTSTENINNNNKELTTTPTPKKCLSIKEEFRSIVASSPKTCISCDFQCSCSSTATTTNTAPTSTTSTLNHYNNDDDDDRLSFIDSTVLSLGQCGEVEIDSNDLYQWSLLVKE